MMDWSGADPIYPALAGLLIGAAAGYHKEEKAILHEAMLKEQTYSESLMKSKNELEEVVRIKNMFVTMVAHDLRSPLSGAAELLRLVLSEEIDEAEYKSNLEMIADSLDHTVKLVGNILDLERFRGGHLNINKERFDVSSVVSRTAYLFLPVAEPKGIKISGLIEPETFFWKADIELISEVISNLVSNALKYIPKGKNGNIEISQSKTDPLVLVVKDNGKGMSPARLRHVLESDMIGSSLGTSGEKGTGLGLSFCKEIIKAHGGRLWAESTEGEGTTFYIKLPPS
jgi:signal transduction histidine kinase